MTINHNCFVRKYLGWEINTQQSFEWIIMAQHIREKNTPKIELVVPKLNFTVLRIDPNTRTRAQLTHFPLVRDQMKWWKNSHEHGNKPKHKRWLQKNESNSFSTCISLGLVQYVIFDIEFHKLFKSILFYFWTASNQWTLQKPQKMPLQSENWQLIFELNVAVSLLKFTVWCICRLCCYWCSCCAFFI